MVGKNNFKEKLRQMVTQNKREHFAIRKLTIGAVSVLLGVTFLGVNNQTAKADTVTSTPATQTKKQPDLTTYQALKSFLKSDDQAAQANAKPAATTNTNKPQANDDPATSQPAPTESDQSVATTNTSANIVDNDTATTKPTATTNTSTNITNNDNATTKPAVTTKDEVTNNPDYMNYNGSSKLPSDASAGKDFSTTTDSTVYIGNWTDFTAAIANPHIDKINLINNIASNTTGRTDLDFPQRRLVVQSDPTLNKKFILDLRFSGPRPSDALTKTAIKNGNTNCALGAADVTYNNLRVYSQSYYGISNSMDATDSPTKLTLNNTDFIGSQLTYSGQYTSIYFEGNVNADSVFSYVSPLDGKTYTSDGGGQQLIEFWEGSQNIYFKKGCNFVGSTSDGNVIEMSNGNVNNKNHVVLESGSNVTLNPCKNPGSGIDVAQHTNKASAIVSNNGEGDVTVQKNAELTINVGTPDYTGGKDKNAAAAITLTSNSGNGAAVVDNGTITVNTNGDISSSTGGSSKANVLIYDQGNLTIGPGGSLNVYGKNMQDYTGTLLYISGKADLNGGSLDIELQDDPDHPGDKNFGAGKGKVNLVDVVSNTALTVNNPKKLVLNASLNKTPGTSIIGDNEVDIKNVRQQFDLAAMMKGLPGIVLPPFHILKVQSDGAGIKVLSNGIETLNGDLKLSDTAVDNINNVIKIYPKIGDNLAAAFKLKDHPEQLIPTLRGMVNKVDYDQIFTTVIDQAFSTPDSFGYNNISMIPTNSGGFLNIEDDNGFLGQASYHQNMKDGSLTISGKVINYDSTVDGPEQPNNMFSQIMHCGTKAYIIAKIGDSGTTYVDPKHPVDSPYLHTKNIANDLTKEFTAEVNPDGTFSFDIPTGTVVTGDTISLTAEANFVGFDPEDKDHTSATVQIGPIADIQQIKTTADNNIDKGLEIAKQRIIASGLSEADQQEFLDAVQDAHDNDEYYIDNATTFTTVNTYLTYAYDTYNQEGAKSEFKYYVQQCEQKLNITDADKDMQTIINNTMTLCNGAIATSIYSDHVESKTEDCLTNQNRDWAEGYALDRFKCWVNDQMSALVTNQMDTCKNDPSLNLTADQIASLKDRSHTVLTFAQSDVTSASDIDVVVEKYQAGVKQINDFFTTNLNSISRNDAISNVQAKWAEVMSKLDRTKGIYPKLSRPDRRRLQQKLSTVAPTAMSTLMNCPDADVSPTYNQAMSDLQAILDEAQSLNK
ncbi:YSIRK-type signal peptide-containing protein [Lactobacillus sp. ESL0679]|uniref:YSIRK-type signal peptide-containing protein n=1 Tax=Lactobacillus sp. ESL0679 TaxID=2983209 RepID=UPI0023F82F2F|nr:YSIRK-type signal peptide-containing protein [Lactobacillus sp. ESL0679]MDF7683826.1 YSIRK-type signal peptide-containing protein [Lactobacillus sp. ESL0679]